MFSAVELKNVNRALAVDNFYEGSIPIAMEPHIFFRLNHTKIHRQAKRFYDPYGSALRDCLHRKGTCKRLNTSAPRNNQVPGYPSRGALFMTALL
jgi:hypothetical protein